MSLFSYDIEKLKERHKEFMLKLEKFKGIGYGVPKVYFILNKTTNTVCYIGSCKNDVLIRLKHHFKEAIEAPIIYFEYGSVAKSYNDYAKNRMLCDIIYNFHEIDVVIFGEYDTLEKAELVEKALIYNSKSTYVFNLCNYTSINKLSTKAIKCKI
jgi:hypothetical protein